MAGRRSNDAAEFDKLSNGNAGTAHTLFLNAKGSMNDVSPELKAFLDLVLGKTSDDPFVRKLEKALNEAKKNFT